MTLRRAPPLFTVLAVAVFSSVVFVDAAKTLGAGSFSPPETVPIPAGAFIMGSDREEREAAYRLDEQAYGHAATRKGRWYEGEYDRHEASTGAFAITRTPISNADYALFVAEQGYPAPAVDRETWNGYGLIHAFARTHAFSWTGSRAGSRAGPSLPRGRETHPVVLVSHADAVAYAAWLSTKPGKAWRLPREAEWEKAVRGTDGRRFPWGDHFDASRLNSHDAGPFDTLPVGRFTEGAGPFGLLDGAGQVFEWTNEAAQKGRFIVKGGSWDDRGCGVCRPAARHSRPQSLKHILIGFRLVCETC